MKRIAVEEHFSTEEHLEQFRLMLKNEYPVKGVVEAEPQFHAEVRWVPASSQSMGDATTLTSKILDLGEGRIKDMEKDGIDMQVLSLVAPGVQVFEAATATAMARRTNDALSEAVRNHPKKLAGLAAVAPQDPAGAARELERAVKDLGLKGACINSHTKGEYLDDKKFWIIFETAERLGVPIYIHPRVPSPQMSQPYLTYPALASAMCGYGAEVSLHALRLMVSGVFDRYPKLKIIIGHLGEALPFWMWRLDNRSIRMKQNMTMKRLPSEYLKDNFYITTSGNFSAPAFLCAYLQLGAERILFAVDYPLESSEDGVRFMNGLTISEDDKEKVCHSNAERLFRL
jgi:5-carboxyvanillate decarboxylase